MREALPDVMPFTGSSVVSTIVALLLVAIGIVYWLRRRRPYSRLLQRVIKALPKPDDVQRSPDTHLLEARWLLPFPNTADNWILLRANDHVGNLQIFLVGAVSSDLPPPAHLLQEYRLEDKPTKTIIEDARKLIAAIQSPVVARRWASPGQLLEAINSDYPEVVGVSRRGH